MARGDLFYIKTNFGYGLFHEFGSYSRGRTVYLIYYLQVSEISESNISEVICSEYYYQIINFDELGGEWRSNYYKSLLIEKMGVEMSLENLGLQHEEKNPYYENCFLMYLGNYNLPTTAVMPQFTKKLDFSYFTKKYCWYILDEKSQKVKEDNKGKPIKYKKLTDELSRYPDYSGIFPKDLMERFNGDFRLGQEEFWVEKIFERFYEENPYLRPMDLKFDEVKYRFPSDAWRHLTDDTVYIRFCDRIESNLREFIERLENNEKAVHKSLVKLIQALNNIESETGMINTLESEGLFLYIVNILQSLKRPRLIETLELLREW